MWGQRGHGLLGHNPHLWVCSQCRNPRYNCTCAYYSDSEDEDFQSMISAGRSELPRRFKNVYNHTKKTQAQRNLAFASAATLFPNAVAPPAVVDNKVVFDRSASAQMSHVCRLDAVAIAWAAAKPGQVTVVCAVLGTHRDIQAPGSTYPGYHHPQSSLLIGKKFVFTNLFEYDRQAQPEYDNTQLVRTAHRLGYHVVRAQQSHAEMGLLQFLEQRRATYKSTPAAWGCSRNVCAMCAELLDALWGPGWHRMYGGVRRDGWYLSNRWYAPAALVSAVMRCSWATQSFRLKYAMLGQLPQWASHWRSLAPEYFCCQLAATSQKCGCLGMPQGFGPGWQRAGGQQQVLDAMTENGQGVTNTFHDVRTLEAMVLSGA